MREHSGDLARSILPIPGRLEMDRSCSMHRYNMIQHVTTKFYKSWPMLYSGMGYSQRQFKKKRDASPPDTGFHGLELSSLPFYSTLNANHSRNRTPGQPRGLA